MLLYDVIACIDLEDLCKEATWLDLNANECKRGPNVATPLWAKCEDETHTPKSGNLESSGTPKNSELDCRGQNTLH